jgi:hypothetical protein
MYWDVDNWVRVSLANSGGTLRYQCGYNDASTTGYAETGTPSTGTWYWLKIVLTSTTYEAFYSTNGTSWTSIRSAARPAGWSGSPAIIIGKGYSDNPTYSGANFNNSYSPAGSSHDYYAQNVVVLPYKSTGNWRSQSISMPTGSQLQSLTVTVSNGSASNKITKVEIIKASDNSVLSTRTVDITSTITLYSADFDFGFSPTLSTDIKVKVYFASAGSDTILLEELSGNFSGTPSSMGTYQHKVIIGSMSTETDELRLKSWTLGDGRNEVPEIELNFVDTEDAEAIEEDDIVEMYRRESGEATWGDTFFYGYVRSITKPLRKNEVSVRCIGILGVMFERQIPFAVWGNTHIVDETLPIALTLNNGYVQRLTATLDADKAPQVPLERLRLLLIREGVWAALTPGVWRVFDQGAGVNTKVAQSFIAGSGEFRKVWLKGYQNAGGNVADLVCEIQTDNNGVPSGTIVATLTSPRANWGVGVGNESWVELDFFAAASDATQLVLQSGSMYWIVLRVSAAGANNYFELRCSATADMLPLSRRGVESVNGGAYIVNAAKFAIYYGMDFESHWIDLDYTKGEYKIEDDAGGAHLIYFVLRQLQGGDQCGQYSWRRDGTVPILFTGQKLVRATYWKGTITYATVFQSWAKAIVSDLYTVLDISITEPATKQYCIQLENSNGLDALETLAKNCPVVARVYKSAAGAVTLEVRDAKFPNATTWNLYSSAQKSVRTFYDSRDSPVSQNYVRIVDGQVFRNFKKAAETAIIRNMGGDVLAAGGGAAGTGKSLQRGSVFLTGGIGVGYGDFAGQTIQLADAGMETEVGGNVTLEGLDQSLATGPFRHCNELVYLKISRKGIDGIFCVKGVRWSGGTGKPTALELGFLNPEWIYRTPSVDRIGGLKDGSTLGRIEGITRGLTGLGGRIRMGSDRQREDGSSGCPAHHSGASECPTSLREDIGAVGVSLRADIPLMYREPTHTYLPSKVYFLEVGTGTPAGVNLGYKIGQVRAKAFVMASGFVMLQAQLRKNDIGLNRSWPQVISEIGFGYADDYAGTNFVQVAAYSVNPTSGAGNIWAERPEFIPGRRVTLAIQVVKP